MCVNDSDQEVLESMGKFVKSPVSIDCFDSLVVSKTMNVNMTIITFF